MLASGYISALDIFSTFMKTGDIKAYRLSKPVHTGKTGILEVRPLKLKTCGGSAGLCASRLACSKCRCCSAETDVARPVGEHKVPLDI